MVVGDVTVGEQDRATILVVDDEVLIRFVQAEALRDAGFTVVEAASGDEALSLLKAGIDVDLMITDVRMPGTMDGLELARAAHALFPRLVIAVSSAHVGTAPAVLHDIIADFLPKPYLPSRLINMAERLLELR